MCYPGTKKMIFFLLAPIERLDRFKYNFSYIFCSYLMFLRKKKIGYKNIPVKYTVYSLNMNFLLHSYSFLTLSLKRIPLAEYFFQISIRIIMKLQYSDFNLRNLIYELNPYFITRRQIFLF